MTSARTPRTRDRRPSALRSVGNPADAAPVDTPDDASTAAAPAAPADVEQPAAEQPATGDAAPAGDGPAAESAPAPRKSRARTSTADSTGKAASGTTGRSTTAGRKSAAAGTKGKSDTGAADAAKAEVAASAGRPGRPRVPHAGPVTRLTLDLAVSEQRKLEDLAGVIGRKAGRGAGRSRIRVQHLARVAVRRLLTDDAFREAVIQDIADNRDELKRQD